MIAPLGQSEVQSRLSEGRPEYSDESTWGEAYDRLGVAAAQITLDGVLVTANDRLSEILGRSKGDLLTRNFRELFQAGESASEFERELSRLVNGEMHRYSAEMSAAGTDGARIWFEVVFSVVFAGDGSTPRRLTLVAMNATPLKTAARKLHEAELARSELSRRVLDAQDADRSRIARELHDDIGQSLAVLKIRMLRAGKPVSGHTSTTHPDLHQLTGEVDAIVEKVSRLSHGLHSSVLEYLGLAAAVQSQCFECSKQLRIPVNCLCDHVERELDGLMALSFLRVVQEALHNAAKHSSAKSIVVRLNGSEDHLSLEIYDDGVGFDIESARLAAGLGLISMRERIHLIGGEFNITSSPGNGTRITARAPMTMKPVS